MSSELPSAIWKTAIPVHSVPPSGLFGGASTGHGQIRSHEQLATYVPAMRQAITPPFLAALSLAADRCHWDGHHGQRDTNPEKHDAYDFGCCPAERQNLFDKDHCGDERHPDQIHNPDGEQDQHEDPATPKAKQPMMQPHLQ